MGGQSLYNLVLTACARCDEPDLDFVVSFLDAMRDAHIPFNSDTYDAIMETYLKNQLFAEVLATQVRVCAASGGARGSASSHAFASAPTLVKLATRQRQRTHDRAAWAQTLTLSQARRFGVAVPVLEAAAAGLVPGGQVGLN